MAEICTTSFGNPGVKCDKGDERGVPVGLLLTTKTFSFASFSSWATEADYVTAVKAKTMFPVNGFLEFDDNTEEAVYYNSPLGVDKFLRDGKYKLLFRGDYGLNQNKELQKFSGMKGRAFIIDSNGYIWGYSDDGATVQGFSIASFKSENQKVPTADAPGWTSLNITFANPREWNDYGQLLKPDFIADDLTSLSNVDVAVVGTATATDIVLSVGAVTGNVDGDGALDNVPIAAIPEADFIFKKASDGTTQTSTGFTDNGDGTYAFTFAAAVTGTGNLISAATQTNDFLIESTGAASFTIP